VTELAAQAHDRASHMDEVSTPIHTPIFGDMEYYERLQKRREELEKVHRMNLFAKSIAVQAVELDRKQRGLE